MKRVSTTILLAGVALWLLLAPGATPAAAASIESYPVPAVRGDLSPTGDLSPECKNRVFLPSVFATRPAAIAPPGGLPSLDEFAAQVSGGAPGQVRGVYVPDVLALPVLQQPEDQPYYVTPAADAVTQFRSAADYGVTGLLAHNYLAGTLFYQLAEGQDVFVIDGGGEIHPYRVAEIVQYQALDPFSSRSPLVDLSTGEEQEYAQVFLRVYSSGDRVTFQTCIEKNGIAAWGRYFVLATPTVG